MVASASLSIVSDLALSGGSVRGLSHIGVLKVLSEAGIQPERHYGNQRRQPDRRDVRRRHGLERNRVPGARAHSGPSCCTATRWNVFAPSTCPQTFADLKIPFAAITTELPAKRAVVITQGELASAISASCALRGIRRTVRSRRKAAQRWRHRVRSALGSLPGHGCGLHHRLGCMGSQLAIAHGRHCSSSPRAGRTYPQHYRSAVRNTNLIDPSRVPLCGYLPGPLAVERMISAGEAATRLALDRFTAQAA